MPFAPQTKVSGDLIRSADWNEAMTEVVRLDSAKLNITGGNISGPLAVGSGIAGGTQMPALRVLNNGTFAWGNSLSIDQTVAGNSDGPKIRFQKVMAAVPAGKSWSAGIMNGPTQGHFIINEDTGNGFGTNRLTIAPGGNVGIGTPNPTELLQIGDRWTFHNGANKVIGFNTTRVGGNDVRIVAGGASQLRFNNDGSLIIRNIPNGAAGTLATGSDISFVDGSIRFSGMANRSIKGEARSGSQAVVVGGRWDELEIKGRVLDWTGSNLHIGYENDHANDTVFFGNGRLGRVEISAPTSLNFGSSVRQMINLWNTDYGIGVQGNTQYFRTGAHFAWHRGGVHSDNQLDAGAGGARLMYLNNSGQLFVAGIIVPNSGFSDKKLKKNISQINNPLEQISKLRGVSFEWKDNNNLSMPEGVQIGFIAQEVEAVFPEWVGEHEDGTKYLAPKGLDAYLVECIKALYEEITMLKAQLIPATNRVVSQPPVKKTPKIK